MWSGSYGRCLFTTSQQHSSRTAPAFRRSVFWRSAPESFRPAPPWLTISQTSLHLSSRSVVSSILVPERFAPEDLKIGDRIRHAIHDAIQLHDKLLLILSDDSVHSQWVEDEVGSVPRFSNRLDG